MIAYLKSLKFRIFLLIILFGIAPTFLLRTGILSVYEKTGRQYPYRRYYQSGKAACQPDCGK